MLLLSSAACKKGEDATFFQVQSWFGDVKLSTRNGDILPGIGASIDKGTTVKTGAASVIDIKCGTSGVLRVSENTTILVTSLFNPNDPAARDTNLELVEGRVFMGIAKLEKGSNLQVKTSTAVASVRGTSFRVSAENGEARIDVLAGKIRVNPIKDGKVVQEIETIVEKNDVVTLDAKKVDEVIAKKEIAVRKITPDEVAEIQAENGGIRVDLSVDSEVSREINGAGIRTETINLRDKEKEEARRKKDEAQRSQDVILKKEKELSGAKVRGAAQKPVQGQQGSDDDNGLAIPKIE